LATNSDWEEGKGKIPIKKDELPTQQQLNDIKIHMKNAFSDIYSYDDNALAQEYYNKPRENISITSPISFDVLKQNGNLCKFINNIGMTIIQILIPFGN
jgi:hypothetical protein